MSSPNLKQTVVALAIIQAFSAGAQAQSAAQTIPEVVISGSKGVDRASVAHHIRLARTS